MANETHENAKGNPSNVSQLNKADHLQQSTQSTHFDENKQSTS
jgi:hypothetical protein